MKLIMTLLVRDEEDIIAANIEYHLSQGVDFFIVTDNLSEDETPEILSDYQQQGLVHIIKEPADNYSQYRWVTRMACMAFTEYAADWVINNDADEFWWAEEEGDSLKSVLLKLPADIQALRVDRQNFLPPQPDNIACFAQAMIIREQVSLNTLGQKLPPKVCHRALANIEVAQGNHSVSCNGVAIDANPTEKLTIFHFPVRSYNHFKNKIVKGGQAYERNQQLDKGIGATWRNLYECYQSGGLSDYYQSQILTNEELIKGLENKSLVRDTRLRDYLNVI